MYVLIGHYNPVFVSYFAAHNIPYYIIKDTKRHPQSSNDSAHGISVDFSDRRALFEAVDALPQTPAAVFTMYEQYIPITAEINRHLGITTALPIHAAEASTDKVRMRQAFAQAPEPISPPFTAVASEAEALAFAGTHGYPVILKPTNLSKSLLITRCDSPEALSVAWQQAVRDAPALYEQFTDGLQPAFILERFMPGSVHTVMGFADAEGSIVLSDVIADNVTARDAGFDDSFIFSRTAPSHLSPSEQAAMLHCAELGMKALGLRSCAAHVELVRTAEGPRLIEIGARVGGYRTAMYNAACGIDVVGAVLSAYSGDLPDVTPTKQAYYRAIEIFPDHKGAFTAIRNFTEASALPSVISARVKCQPGDVTGKASEGYKATAVFELASASEQQITEDYEYIRTHVTAVIG